MVLLTATVPAFDRIVLAPAQSIAALASASETTIWRRKASGVGSNQVWAPETALYRRQAGHTRGPRRGEPAADPPCSSRASARTPLAAAVTEKGLVRTNWDTFSLDASTFVHNGTRYLVWAQQEPSRTDENSSLLSRRWRIHGRSGVPLS